MLVRFGHRRAHNMYCWSHQCLWHWSSKQLPVLFQCFGGTGSLSGKWFQWPLAEMLVRFGHCRAHNFYCWSHCCLWHWPSKQLPVLYQCFGGTGSSSCKWFRWHPVEMLVRCWHCRPHTHSPWSRCSVLLVSDSWDSKGGLKMKKSRRSQINLTFSSWKS